MDRGVFHACDKNNSMIEVVTKTEVTCGQLLVQNIKINLRKQWHRNWCFPIWKATYDNHFLCDNVIDVSEKFTDFA